MWRNRQYASHRMTCDRDALQIEGKALLAPATRREEALPTRTPRTTRRRRRTGREERKAGPTPTWPSPPPRRHRYEAAFDRFCAVFPDAFYVAERGRNYLDKTRDRGRLLSAGFHNLMGYFRDDQPLYQLLLDRAQQKQLDRLWRELDFVAAATRRTYTPVLLQRQRRRGRADAEEGTARMRPGRRPGGHRRSPPSRRCSERVPGPGRRQRRAQPGHQGHRASTSTG